MVEWNDSQFKAIDVESITKDIQVYFKVANQAAKQLTGNQVAPLFAEKVDNFKNTLPVVMALRNKALKPRHWESITETLGGMELDLDAEDFTLGKLLEMGVSAYMEQIQAIAGTATAELALEEMLQKVRTMWESGDDSDLTLMPYKEFKDVFILGGVDNIIVQLEDSLVSIGTIAGSRFVGPIRDEVEQWQKDLMLFQETLDEWLGVQRQWMYLESIFSAGDIKKQLPTEAHQFQEVDTAWKTIMRETHENPTAIKAGTKPGRLQLFKQYNETLDRIQKQLEDYLQSKRVAFPRFFFLSNDELLEILAQARRPQAVQPHLRKCFDALVKLKFASDKGADINGMVSGEGEEIPFYKPLKARGNVEKWLLDVEDWMCKTVHHICKEGHKAYPEQARRDWVREREAQTVSCVGMIMWCTGAEEALQSDKNRVEQMKVFYQQNVTQLSELTELVRGKLTSIQRKSIVALVTQDVHNRDIVEAMCVKRVQAIMDFTWQQQLRYYWDYDQDDCIIRQVDAMGIYGYEYMGATSRLVITPLTDRCWMTITGALHIKLGAAPAGPAGTGKTESTKDLAKAIARQCVVFNCSDQIDYKMMGKLFSGLATSGAWTCLDEFNRILIEVLSVVAQQLQTIRTARVENKTQFVFEGNQLALKWTMGVFITMNPGYAGRTELPDNLKVLFRPMAMMVPDYTLIAEIMLYAEGFGTAKKLSGKFTKLYKLSSEQLSKQDHYDFGMRAVKSVLVMAGSLKRLDPDLDEDILLIRAMRDSNVPKFLADDLPLFAAIVSDMFPGVEVPFISYGNLQTAIEYSLSANNFQVEECIVTKTIQLYETFNVRFGVMLVGFTMGGKTTIYRTLSRALTKLRKDKDPNAMFQEVRYDLLNPKCISMGELYGEFNELTQEWTDGLASTLMRNNVADETPDYKWTIFDGPVDAIWIESMNTVLDDNMTLCLANGERIKLKPEMRMLFEVNDLAVASPATVSRCGMVYVTFTDLGWRPSVATWLQNLPEKPWNDEAKAKLNEYFEKFVDVGINWIRKNGKEPVSTFDYQLVASLMHNIEGVLNWDAFTANSVADKNCVDAEGEPLPQFDVRTLDPKEFEKYIFSVFCFSFCWSIGASVDSKSREKFGQWAESAFDANFLPRNGGVFDGYIDLKAGPKWRSWDEIVPSFAYNPEASYFSLLVPNQDTVRFSYVQDRLVGAQHSVYLTGSSGVGKSVVISAMLEQMKACSGVVPA